METKKYVRIKKANDKHLSYSAYIGRVYIVIGESENEYFTPSVNVLKEDAELIVTENRKAAAGERVLITDTGDPQAYENGKEYEVRQINSDGVSVIGRSLALFHNEYEVIVNYEVKNEEVDGMENVRQTVIDHAYTVFEKNNGQYLGYKSRFGDIALGGVYSEEFVMNYANVNESVLIVQDSTLLKPRVKNLPEKFAQARRDEIVEQAKADVWELTNNGDGVRYKLDAFYHASCEVEFVVNRHKRTVVVLLKGIRTREVYARGIAKTAPSDCFNVHIGRAIALRRALGLVVPDEYLNAPQPTEVRVGDVVRSTVDKSKVYVISEGEKSWYEGAAGLSSMVAKYGTIIDDSREEVGGE